MIKIITTSKTPSLNRIARPTTGWKTTKYSSFPPPPYPCGDSLDLAPARSGSETTHVPPLQWCRGVRTYPARVSPRASGLGAGIGDWGLGFTIWSLGVGVWDLGLGVCGLEFGVWSLEFGVWSLRIWVWGLGFKICG